MEAEPGHGIEIQIESSPRKSKVFLDGEDISRYVTRAVLTTDAREPANVIELTLVHYSHRAWQQTVIRGRFIPEGAQAAALDDFLTAAQTPETGA